MCALKPADFTPEIRRPYDVRIEPAPVPPTGVFDSPLVCLRVNGKWASHVDGVLERLLFRDAWTGTDLEIERAIGEIRRLLAAIGAGGTLKERCAEYPASNLRISYAPNDPYLTPNLTPPGYVVPPWYTNPAIPLPGVLPGDAMVNFAGVPAVANLPTIDIAALLQAGFPRFRVNGIEGNKTVELHLVSVPQGGNAIITVDGGLIPVSVVELNANVTALPAPEAPGVTVEEISVTGDGMHFIDVTFVPIIDNEAGVPVFHGGGLRKVVICGLTPDCEDESMPFDVRQNTVNPCKLEKTDDGVTWVQFADLRLCKPQIRVVPGIGGAPPTVEQSIDGGATWTPADTVTPPIPPRSNGATESDKRCLAAANAAAVIQLAYEEIRTTYASTTNVLTLATSVFVLLGFIWVFPPAILVIIPIIASMIAIGGFNIAVMDADDVEAIQCILFCNASVGAGNVVTFDFDQVMTEMQAHAFLPVQIAGIMLPLLTEDGLNRAGATTSISSADCSDCPCGWCYTFDFTQSNGGWLANEAGTYVAGQGWRDTLIFAANNVNRPRRQVSIRRQFVTSNVTSVEVVYSRTFGNTSAMSGDSIFVLPFVPLDTGSPTQENPFAWTGSVTTDDIGVALACSGRDSAGDPGGIVTISRITLRGTGENPFGADNC